MNMSKRMEWGYREHVVTMSVVGGGTRSGMLTTTPGGVGEKEQRIRRETAKLNRNQNPDRDQS